MADLPKVIVVRCPACTSRLKASEKLIGKRTQCPKCKQTITIPPPGQSPKEADSRPDQSTTPEQQAPAQLAVEPALEKAVASTAPPGAEAQPDEGQGLTGVRWNFLVSLGWLLLGWSLARLAPWAALGPAWFESVLNVLPLAITMGLIGWNLWASLRILGRTGRALAALPLTSLQFLLFTLLFYQIACHRGADHFVWERVPGLFDWVALLVVHALRAADVMDAIEAYGLNLQAVHNASHLTAWTLILYHVVIDLFILRLLMEGVGRWRRSLVAGSRARRWVWWGSLATVLAFVAIWLLSALVWRPWQVQDLVLWPVDNVLRVVDFVDGLEIYHVRLHEVPRLPWEGTLTLVCRVLMALLLASWPARAFQELSVRFLRGRGLKREELDQIAARYANTPRGELAQARAAELKHREEHPAPIHWPSPLEVLSTLGPAGVLALFLFLAGYDDASPRLAAAAAGPEDAPAQRALAALRRLGARGGAAVEPLAEALPKLSPSRQPVVLETLGHLGPSAVEPLSQCLGDDDGQIRVASLEALRRIGPAALPALVAALASDDERLREDAKTAIQSLGDDAVPLLLDQITEDNAVDLLELLESVDPYWHLRRSDNPHFPALVEMRALFPRLREAETESQLRVAVERLTETGPAGRASAVSELGHLLESGNPAIRFAAAQISVELDSAGPETVRVLAGFLAESESEFHDQARRLLGQMNASAVPALLEWSAEADREVDARTVEVLSSMGAGAVPALRQESANGDTRIAHIARGALEEMAKSAAGLLADANLDVRRGAVDVLKEIGVPAATVLREQSAEGDAQAQQRVNNVLKEMAANAAHRLAVENPDVRQEAADVLKEIGPAAVPGLTEQLSSPSQEVAQLAGEVLTEIGAAGVPGLVEQFAGSEPAVRQRVIAVLNRIGPPAAPPLIDRLAHVDPAVRQGAADLLVAMGATAVPVLTERLKDADLRIRGGVQAVLARIGTAAVPELAEQLTSGDQASRQAATQTLKNMGPEAVPTLIGRLSDADPQLRQDATDLLAQIGATAAPALCECLARAGPGIEHPAAQALRRMGGAAVPALVDRLTDADQNIRRGASDVLKEIGAPALPVLIGRFADGDPSIQEQLADVLTRIGAPAAPMLVERLADPNPDVRHRAANVLEQIGTPVVPVVVGIYDRISVTLWDAGTGEQLNTSAKQEDLFSDPAYPEIFALAFSPDGGSIAAVCYPGTMGAFDVGAKTLRLWDAVSGRHLHSLTADMGHYLAFSADSKRVAVGGEQTVRLWDPITGEQLPAIDLAAAGVERVASLAFSPDGKRIAAGAAPNAGGLGMVAVWDANTAERSLAVPIHGQQAITSLAFSADGKQIVSAGVNGTILWRVGTRFNKRSVILETAKSVLALSVDGTKAVTAEEDGAMLWDPRSDKKLHSLAGSREVHFSSSTFSPDGKWLAGVGGNQTVTVWDVSTGKLLRTLALPKFSCIALGPEGIWFAKDAHTGAVTIWHAAE